MKITHYAVKDLGKAREAFKDFEIRAELWSEIERTFAAITKLVAKHERPRYLASCLVFHVVNESLGNSRAFRVFRERLADPLTRDLAVIFLNDPAMRWREFEDLCVEARVRAAIMEGLTGLLAGRPAGAPLSAEQLLRLVEAGGTAADSHREEHLGPAVGASGRRRVRGGRSSPAPGTT